MGYTLNAEEARELIRYFLMAHPNRELSPADMCIFAMLVKAWDLDPMNPQIPQPREENE